jgi:mRNA-degrading endonuclease RelE of RelBE toxin-antitoxin system
LIYQVDNDRVIVVLVKIGQREGGKVYKDLDQRLAEEQ